MSNAYLESYEAEIIWAQKDKKESLWSWIRVETRKACLCHRWSTEVELAANTDAWEISYVVATKAQNKTATALAQRDKALRDLAEI